MEGAPQAPVAQPESTQGSQRRTWVLIMHLAAVVVLLVAAGVGLWALDWPSSLNAALGAMALFVGVETAVLSLWAKPYSAAPDGNAAGNPYADAAKVAITTQGVVLGLVAFQNEALSPTIKVGACALVVGVLTAAVLYLAVVQGPPPDSSRKLAAACLFCITYWSLGFGLICVLAGSW